MRPFAESRYSLRLLAVAIALGTATPALAQSAHDSHGSHAGHGNAAAVTEAATMSEGSVRKVDKAAGKLTIAHGPLTNLNMPAMTMAFRVADAAMLDKVKAGDKIRFTVERVDGVFTVTALEIAP